MSKEVRRDKYFSYNVSSSDNSKSFSASNDYLPIGVSRDVCDSIFTERLTTQFEDALEQSDKNNIPIKVAAFDFDGTCIDTSSPKKLVLNLWRNKVLGSYITFRAGIWGLAYKLNLPRDEEAVRIRVFSAFKNRSASIINRFLADFYNRYIDAEFRTSASACMAAHLEVGHVVVVVSATFEPIVAEAMTKHPIQFAIATRMKIEDGKYTDIIQCNPANGEEKLQVLKRFLDEKFGEGKWELTFSYSDHFSDIELLDFSKNPVAVNPDNKLLKYANSHNWNIEDWN